jgi:hypothetical protein
MNEKCEHEYVDENGNVKKCGNKPTTKASDDKYICFDHLEEHLNNDFKLN